MRRKKSTQALMGLETFGRFGLCANRSELAFFHVQPTNISVLSAEHIDTKIHQLTQLLSVVPELEIVALDSCERFDENKIHLKNRIAEERNTQVRMLLKADLAHISELQTQHSTARQFLFCIRFRNAKSEQLRQQVSRVYKMIAEYGFAVKRMEKADLKRMLAVYFGCSLQGESLPDTEGENYLEVKKNGDISKET